eukprot:4837303-Pyramimonas_sp.AAC.1
MGSDTSSRAVKRAILAMDVDEKAVLPAWPPGQKSLLQTGENDDDCQLFEDEMQEYIYDVELSEDAGS